jgi:hypothetical protein
MAYKTVNRAADSGLFVVESLRTYKDEVHDRLVARWRARRPDEEPPRFDLVIDFMADELSDSRVEMVSGLEQHINETAVDRVDRKEREEAVSEARSWYQYFRDHCLNAYGSEETQVMGFALLTEEHPRRLGRQVERALNFFKGRDPEERILPKEPLKAEGALRAGYVVEVLSPRLERLNAVLEALLTEGKMTEKAFLHKERLREDFVERFNTHAKCSEMLYRWAGLDREAKRIKPSTRRPGQREEEVEGPDAGSEAGVAPDGDAPDAGTREEPVTP